MDDSNTPELNAAVSRDDTGRRYLLTRQSGQNQPIHEIWAHMAYPNESLDQVFNIVWRGPSQNREYPAIGGGRSNYLVGWEHQRYPDTNRDIHGHVAGYVVFLPFIQRDPLPKQVIVDPPGSPPNNRGEV